MRLAENRIELQRSGQASHHPADRRVAEILVGDEGIDLDEIAERTFEPRLGARQKGIVLVEAIERDHGVDRAGV